MNVTPSGAILDMALAIKLRSIRQDEIEAWLNTKPDDWEARKAYVSWLEDYGQLLLAQAQRWMVKNRKHPHTYVYLQGEWNWHAFPNHLDAFRIPDEIMALIGNTRDIPEERQPNVPVYYRYYKERQDAELDLAEALVRAEADNPRLLCGGDLSPQT